MLSRLSHYLKKTHTINIYIFSSNLQTRKNTKQILNVFASIIRKKNCRPLLLHPVIDTIVNIWFGVTWHTKILKILGRSTSLNQTTIYIVLIKVKWTLHINKGGKSVLQADLEEVGSKGGIRLVYGRA